MCAKFAIMRFIGLIPARYASTRFEGKPLALIGGKPMIERVYRQASMALEQVVVATDDERIETAVRAFGGKVVMTASTHTCGTDRLVEAANRLGLSDEDIVINIQGDEPFVQPSQIDAIRRCFDDPKTQIATLVKPFAPTDGLSELENPNSPKVIVEAKTMHALWFSRSVIPYLRGVEKEHWLDKHRFYKHIGMYAYYVSVLKAISALPPSPMEIAESLEQLRWLENGYSIRVAVTEVETIGIDTPADLVKANQIINNLK